MKKNMLFLSFLLILGMILLSWSSSIREESGKDSGQTQYDASQTQYDASQTQYVESLLPEGKQWKMVWHDEFEGDQLDTTKWGIRLHIMQTRYETRTTDAYDLDGQGKHKLKFY